MKKIVLLLGILFIGANSAAQHPLDSIASIWQDETKHDTVRLNALNEFAYRAGPVIGPDSLMGLAQVMLDLAADIGSQRYQVDAQIQQSRCFLFFGKFQEALQTASEASASANEISYVYGEARALALMAFAHEQMGNLAKSIQYRTQMYEIFSEEDKEPGKPIYGEINAFRLKPMLDNYHNDVGLVYQRAGLNAEALEYFNQALKSSLLNGSAYQVGSVTNNIANVYGAMGEYDLAIKYYEEARDLFEEIGHKEFLANSIGNLGDVYSNMKSYEKAEEYLKRHLQMRHELGYPFEIARAFMSLATLEARRQEYEKTLEFARSAEEILRQPIPNFSTESLERAISQNKQLQGYAYLELGNYDKAIKLFSESYQFEKAMNSPKDKANISQYLYLAYKKAGQPRNSLKYHEEYTMLKDSLSLGDVSKKLLQVDYTRKKLTDSLLQVEENNRLELAHEKELLEETNTRNIFVASGLILLIVSGGLWNRLNFTRKSRTIIEKERDRSDNLLLNILPAEVAEELKQNGEAKARDFEMVTVLFTDFKGFTEASEILSANELVDELNYFFKGFDRIMEKYGIEKIKTIGDAYMAVGGLHGAARDGAVKTTLAALEMQEFVIARKKVKESQGLKAFDMRVGLHSGPVVAGIVGVKKFQYDIWGDTVNTASRMESAGQVGKVNISQATYDFVCEEEGFSFKKRGKIDTKGKGELDMYFVSIRQGASPHPQETR